MNQYYEQIMALKEADEIKPVVERWRILSENIKSRPTDSPIVLPDMLWVAKSGVGKTHLLRLLSGYLTEQRNLMEFFGDVPFFEFLVSYCKPDEPFSELNRLIDEVDNAAGFRNTFKGIVHIDINEWLEHFTEKHFISLMEYLAANSDQWLVVLSVSADDAGKIHNLYAFLSMYLRIEKVTLSLPKTADLFEYIQRQLSGYGLELSEDARALLHETIEKLRKNKYFDGFKTIKMLCQDIVYSVFSCENMEGRVLTAQMLTGFRADSDYVKRTVANIERVNRIGLVDKE